MVSVKHCDKRRHSCGEVQDLEERVRKLSGTARRILERQVLASSRHVQAAKLLKSVLEFVDDYFKGRRDAEICILAADLGDLKDRIERFFGESKA